MKLATVKNLKLRGLRHRIANPTGAIDLASIMVGVLVIGVVGSVIAATVMAVIPWSQDQAAKQNLSSVATASSAIHALDGNVYAYDSHEDSEYRALESAEVGLERPGQRLVIDTGTTAGSWVAAQSSASGAVFIRTSNSPDVYEAVEQGYLMAAGAGSSAGTRTLALPAGLASLPSGITESQVESVVDAVATGARYDFGALPKLGYGAPAAEPAPELPSADAAQLNAYLAAQGEFYKSNEGAFHTTAGIAGGWTFDSSTDPSSFIPASDNPRVVDAPWGAGQHSLIASGEGLTALQVNRDGSIQMSQLSIVWPEDTDWENPDFSAITYAISTPVDIRDYNAVGSVFSWLSGVEEVQYSVHTTLTFMGLPSADGPGAWTPAPLAGGTEPPCEITGDC